MKSTSQAVTVVTYTSEVRPDVTSTNESDADTIAWADANPVAWKIVTSHKSAPYGKKSCFYIGWAQGSDSNAAVLCRIGMLLQEGRERRDSIWGWRARFTLKHYEDKQFKGGFFQQFDGEYDRGCMSLDYTPATREEVIDKFVEWCAQGPCRYATREIRIDGKCVRRYDADGKVV